ncbi:hypothetical protein Sango_1931100 [Sesamum angolense]|uniref:Uncharacterized protein n=1 Tax=Sesamum angolense TaxID=2727404 RepID=A0AAE2BN97_9LAMI|nr:hypothetical protein Sango_1931100 [Sesamum angolense]
MAGEYVSKGLRVVAAVGATFLSGSFALGFLTSSISERITYLKGFKNVLTAWDMAPCNNQGQDPHVLTICHAVLLSRCTSYTCTNLLPCDPSRFFLAEVRRLALLV